MALRLDGYVRVSRVGGREGEGYISPDVQREAIAAYAGELGGEIAAWHDDQDFSGGSVERPGFQAALERLRAGATEGVVVMRIDRFARSVADGASIVREIVDRGQVFAACHERIDPRTPEGRYMLNSFLANAELFLDQSKAAWWTAKSRAIARGAHIGPTPIGYERQDGRLLPHPELGPVITGLFERAATRKHGDSALARWVSERVPRERRDFQPSEIRRWLRSRVYLGEVRYGELVNPEAHEPLTTATVWGRCQRPAGVQRVAPSRFLLSGILRCAGCRYAMNGRTRGGATGTTPIYRCSARCAEASVITAERVEGFVLGEVRRHFSGLAFEGVTGASLDSVEQDLRQAEEAVREFAADLEARRLLGEAGWLDALRLRVADRDAKLERRDQVFASQRVSSLVVRMDDLDRHDLRDLLAAAIRFVFVRRRRGAAASERALIIWADDLQAIEVPGPHRSGPFEPIRW